MRLALKIKDEHLDDLYYQQEMHPNVNFVNSETNPGSVSKT
jgi:hypothetical protein